MFQTYEAPEGGQDLAERTARLRELMAKAKLDAVLVPRADEHQGEYVAPSAERLKWLTGFSGSAGLAVVARTAAALFVDGRYITQAPTQVDTRTFEVLQIPDAKLSDWLGKHLKAGAVVGFDPWLHTAAMIEELEQVAGAQGHQAQGAAQESRRPHLGARAPGAAAGRRRRPTPPGMRASRPSRRSPSCRRRCARRARTRSSSRCPTRLPGCSTSAARTWRTTRWRWRSRSCRPRGKVELFIDPAKVNAEARAHLAKLARISAPKALEDRIKALKGTSKRIRLDANTAASWFFRKLRGGKARIVRGPDPCLLPKARKNAAEIKGARAAHKRDGAAVARFLAWLDREAPQGGLDEIATSRHLETLRSETQALKEISFDTISGAGPNGAIVHYRVTTPTNRKLKPGELYLVDSGAQYIDGTTDITRTVAIGTPTREMQERFTLVLKGHIGIAMARFPKGTRGVDLDPFARRALWEAGLDFDHGTGHGVGSYLSVHEGPQNISKRGMTPLEPGMIVSNEPGYYKQGAYGIRIENLVLVTEPEKVAGGEREVMGFETLTLAPIDRRLVVAGAAIGR